MSTKQVNNRTLDQKRAEHALKRIKDIEGKKYGHFVSYVSSLPATIVMNGLGQAMATLLAKSKGKADDPHRMLYDQVASWLSEQVDGLKGTPDKLIGRMMEQDQDVYIRAQAEAMAYLNWLKQFARAYLNEKEGQRD